MKIVNFIMSTYNKCLIPKTKEDYLYYGPVSFEFMAPNDAIVIGFKYNKYGFDNNQEIPISKQQEREQYICNMLNFLQGNNELKMKIAVLKYDEFSKNRPGIIL